MASMMASTFALSRPSEKFGTHSTSVDIADKDTVASGQLSVVSVRSCKELPIFHCRLPIVWDWRRKLHSRRSTLAMFFRAANRNCGLLPRVHRKHPSMSAQVRLGGCAEVKIHLQCKSLLAPTNPGKAPS